MVKKVIRIDIDNLFVEDVILQEDAATPNDCIETVCQDGFYKPKWDGLKWIEGLTQTEIDTIKSVTANPTETERIASIENMITMIMGV